MITKFINELIAEQKEDYINRTDLLTTALTKEELMEVEEKGKLSNSHFTKIRHRALGLEGDENNASFEEGMLRSLEMIRETIQTNIGRYIKRMKKTEVSQDFILGMEEVHRLIK